MTSRDCGGRKGFGSHRRHCPGNPEFTREREWADQAENLGDQIGVNNFGAANACYRAASLLMEAHELKQLGRR